MPDVIINDFRMHYEVDDFTDPWAEKDTILFHHGFCRNSRFWYRMVPLLARYFRVVRIDARGFGQSDVPPPEYPWTLEGFARDAKGLLDYLSIDRVIWAGEFLGSFVGWRFAFEYPQRTRAIVVFNPSFNLEERRDLPVAGADDFQALDATIDRGGVKAWAQPTIANRLDPSKASPELIQWVCDEMDRTSPQLVKALRRRVRNIMGSIPALFPHIQAPTLLLAGDRSPNSTPAHVEYMKEHIPNTQVVMFEGIGSGLWLLIPEECAQAIREFISKLPPVHS